MNKKALEITLAVLILIALIVLIGFLLFRSKDDGIEKGEVPNKETEFTDEFPDEPISTGPPVIRPQPIARTFVERFGSFSSESDYRNVEDVMQIASADLKTELQQVIEDAKKTAGGGYYGVSTHVLSMNVVEETEDAATLEMLTQRQESFGSPANTSVRYQDIVVSLVRSGDDWVVQSFSWK